MKRLSWLFLAAPLAYAFACSSSSSTGTGVAPPDDDAGAETGTGTGTQCTAAFNSELLPVSKVSTGKVSVLATTGDTKQIYVDASAGGINLAPKNPRVYVNLESGTRVDIDDVTAMKSSQDWDLAMRRDIIWTNSGDAGIGVGGAAMLTKKFATVTAADADAATIAPEKFFDDQCNALKDQTGAPQTTFSDWYDYDQATHIPTPKDVTFIVKGGTGKRYKVAILAYDALPDGGSSMDTSLGYYVLSVAPL